MRAKLKVILPFILFAYILVETILKANNIELCSTTGCVLAGELLKFDSNYLNYLGVISAFTLMVLALIKSEGAQKLYSIMLISMVFFESLLIASQINLNPEVCKFCLGVYALLILMLINDSIKITIILLPAITSIFVAFSILAIPKNKSIVDRDGLYLIASPTCPHCKEAKEFLEGKSIKYSIIDSKDINAFFFAKSLKISKIPIAIRKRGDSYNVLVGSDKIEEFFSSKEESNRTKESRSDTKEDSNELIEINSTSSVDSGIISIPRKDDYYKQNDSEGCTLSILEESNCTQ